MTQVKPKFKENKIKTTWRPVMAWVYMATIICDFIVFPVMFSVLQYLIPDAIGGTLLQWQPITLNGGGLFHAAMGAIIGVTAYSRGREKIEGVSDDYTGYREEVIEREYEEFRPANQDTQ